MKDGGYSDSRSDYVPSHIKISYHKFGLNKLYEERGNIEDNNDEQQTKERKEHIPKPYTRRHNGKIIQVNTKKIKGYDKITGKFYKEFFTMAEAARLVNVSYVSIYDVLKGRSRSAGGYIWKYSK